MSLADVSASGALISETEWHLVQGVVDSARAWWEVEEILTRAGCAHAHESLETMGLAEPSDMQYIEYEDVEKLGVSLEQYSIIKDMAESYQRTAGVLRTLDRIAGK